MEINLKITADPELVALLTRAVKALEKGSVPEVVTTPALVPYSTETPPEFTEAAAETTAVPVHPTSTTPTPADISSQELQTNVVKLTVQKPALRASIKAIVNEYADKLSAIPDGQRGIVWERIKQLAEEN